MELKQGQIVKPAGERWEANEREARYVVAEPRGDRVLITYIGKQTAQGFEKCGMVILPQEVVLTSDVQLA